LPLAYIDNYLAKASKTCRRIHTYKVLMPKKRSVVAVIDDNVGILGAMARLLSALGYETELYASADEFLDVAIMTEAICLIIDVQIGEDSGIDLAIHVAKQGFTIPVIFMSADRAESVKELATEIGCVAFLDKPFSADALIAALTKLPARTPWNKHPRCRMQSNSCREKSVRFEHLSPRTADWQARRACERALASAHQERRYEVAPPTCEVWRVPMPMPHGPDGPCIAPVLHAR
jgi:FixJ family two-component response regulator